MTRALPPGGSNYFMKHFSHPQVTSKPDLYPLVISYNDNSAKGGSYLMVQYLRHYFLRPAGESGHYLVSGTDDGRKR